MRTKAGLIHKTLVLDLVDALGGDDIITGLKRKKYTYINLY